MERRSRSGNRKSGHLSEPADAAGGGAKESGRHLGDQNMCPSRQAADWIDIAAFWFAHAVAAKSDQPESEFAVPSGRSNRTSRFSCGPERCTEESAPRDLSGNSCQWPAVNQMGCIFLTEVLAEPKARHPFFPAEGLHRKKATGWQVWISPNKGNHRVGSGTAVAHQSRFRQMVTLAIARFD